MIFRMNTNFFSFTNNTFRIALTSAALLGLVVETPVNAGKDNVNSGEEEADKRQPSALNRRPSPQPEGEGMTSPDQIAALSPLLEGVKDREKSWLISTLVKAGITSPEQIEALIPLLPHTSVSLFILSMGKAGITSSEQISALSSLLAGVDACERIYMIEALKAAKQILWKN